VRRSRSIVLALVAVAFGYVGLAPLLLLGGCALMTVMLMRGMSGGGDDRSD
jgi:hypothetical protein